MACPERPILYPIIKQFGVKLVLEGLIIAINAAKKRPPYLVALVSDLETALKNYEARYSESQKPPTPTRQTERTIDID